MGEDSFAADPPYTKQRFHHPLAIPHTSVAAENVHQNGTDEPYTIKCICGYDDDTFDGNVVLCDRCNSWQHISCYYFPKTNLEEDFEHICRDCDPSRNVRLDAAAAASRQADLRPSATSSDIRKPKRLATKNQKKPKVRDSANDHESWPNNNHDTHLSEGRADSPRENGPPYKRPKTTHKHSASTNNLHIRPVVNGRKRSDSFSAFATEPAKPSLSQCPPDYFSPDFINIHHHNTDFRPTETNVHHNLDVATLLSNWLDDPEAFAEATDGKSHSDVFKQFPQPLEELERPIQKHLHVDKDVVFHGKNPAWPYLTVETDLVAGEYVGELKGSIGRREEYIQDEANQWPKLRHPDHFVFFHPVLPIYIDSRTEGTVLRNARRSCRPNLKMETIITGAREYRFCFTALHDIQKGAELTIPWDTTHDGQLLNVLRKSLSVMSEDDVSHVSDWVGTILAHFGGCACEQPLGIGSNGPCLLAHFDRRLGGKLGVFTHTNGKSRKRRKGQKNGTLDGDRTVNSRASSHGPLPGQDNDVDMADDRSQTFSTDSKSSRDGTPYNSRDLPAGHPELSERDKRKLMHQEKLFEQMEHDTQQNGQKKRKRNSGSTANTPTTSGPRPFGRSSSLQAVRARGQPSPGSTSDAQTPVGRSVASPSRNKYSRSTAQRPVYADASTQTAEIEAPPKPKPKPFVGRTKQLLQRSLLRNHRMSHVKLPLAEPLPVPASTPPSSTSPGQGLNVPLPAEVPIEVPREAPREELIHEADVVKEESPKMSIAMDDADNTQTAGQEIIPPSQIAQPSIEVDSAGQMAIVEPPVEPAPVKDPRPVPSDKEKEPIASEKAPTPPAPLAPPMHVDLPPPEFAKPITPTESPLQTPTGQGAPTTPLTAPAGSDSVTKPSVMKKKMSLSDYLKRKTETPVTEKAQNPLAKASSPAEDTTKGSLSPATSARAA